MTKKEIKESENNKLIMCLVGDYGHIIAKEGFGCKAINKELNDVAAELVKRNLLTDDDIKWLNN